MIIFMKMLRVIILLHYTCFMIQDAEHTQRSFSFISNLEPMTVVYIMLQEHVLRARSRLYNMTCL